MPFPFFEIVSSTPFAVVLYTVSFIVLVKSLFNNASGLERRPRFIMKQGHQGGGDEDDIQNFKEVLSYVNSGDICGASDFLKKVQFSDSFMKDAQDYIKSLEKKTGGNKTKRARRSKKSRRTRRH